MKTVGYKGLQRDHSSYCNTKVPKQDRFSTQTRQPSQSVLEEYAQTVPTPTLEENGRPRSEVMIVDLVRATTLDKYKCRTEGEKDQQLSGAMVAALTTFLAEYLLDETSTTIPGLNAGTTFVVKVVKPCDDKRSEVREIWTLEDVASREFTDLHVPVALLSHNTTPDAMLNTGVIPILEQGPDDMGMTKYRFSLASLADGRKTPLYGWTWLTFPTFS